MEEITINYENSGIKTLRNVSNIILYTCVILFAGYMLYSAVESNIEGIIFSIIILLGGIFLFSIGYCIATITKNSLYQKEFLKAKAKREDINIMDDIKKK